MWGASTRVREQRFLAGFRARNGRERHRAVEGHREFKVEKRGFARQLACP